jgi:hypothetical protein
MFACPPARARSGVGGVELLSAAPGGMTLRLAEHALTLTLSSGADATLAAVSLEPPSVPVDDLAGGRDANRRVDVAVREVRCAALRGVRVPMRRAS